MTSIILAQKMLSMKLSNNEEHKFKIFPALSKTIDRQVKNKTCRICLKPGKNKIFGDQQFDYVETIKHILQIEVTENDGKPQYICAACETTLKEAEQLKQTAEVTEWRLQQELEMDLQVHQPDLFIPIAQHDRQKYFLQGEWSLLKNETMSNTFYSWSYLTKYNMVPKNSLYDKLAQKYCPAVFEFYGVQFGLV